MSQFGRLVKREFDARREIVGKVLTQRELRNFLISSAPVWVCSVDIGGNRILENVPIKAGANGSRFYAERDAAVLLRREANGRIYVVGPVNRKIGVVVKKTYALGVATPSQTANLGFVFERVPFEYYEGTGPPSGSFWNDGTNPFPLIRVINAP